MVVHLPTSTGALGERGTACAGRGPADHWGREKEKEAPLCRVGGSDEPASAGGTALKSRPLGFLTAEACTRGGVAIRLGKALAQPTARTITGKADSHRDRRPPRRDRQVIRGPWSVLPAIARRHSPVGSIL